MTQKRWGAEKGKLKDKSLQPKLLENSQYKTMQDTRIKVMKFKRKIQRPEMAVEDSPAPESPYVEKNTDAAVYLRVVDSLKDEKDELEHDIYFTQEYAKVNELIENGEAKYFEIKSKNGHITNSESKREIQTTIEGEKYYDLISPYGYGGPIIHDYSNKQKLIEEFNECFSIYCNNNNIVSEFIRFHPVLQNHQEMKGIYDITYMRQTVGTDFKKFEDTFQNEFSRTARTKVRKRLRDDRFSFHIDRGFENVEDFISIYNHTMDRNNASHFYYFNKEYFYALSDKFKKNILTISVKFEDEIIAMGLYFLSGNIIHDHLNGTNPDYLEYSPAYLLKYASMKWGIENGYSLIHYGGGVSNAKDDPVLHFKKRFSKHTEFEFHIGKKIWNNKIYERLCESRGADVSGNFFPAYR